MEKLSLTEKLLLLNTALLSILLIGIYRGILMKLWKLSKVFNRRLIGVCIYNLVRLLPRKSDWVVFGAESGQGFRGNPKYLFLKLRNEPRLRCVWVLKDSRAVRQVRELGFEAHRCHSRKGIYYQLRAKFFVHSHSIHDDFNRYLLGGAVSVNTWHGVGLKKVWGANKKTFTYKALHEKNPLLRFLKSFVVRTQNAGESYVFSTSEKVSSYYPETFLVRKENILELGQARNDVFFQQTEEDEAVPAWIRENRIITYMPTHRNFGKMDKDINRVMDLDRLDAFCEKYGCKFVIKRHMYSSGQVSRSLKHIIDISRESVDPQLLLKYTDILVTDYSSCYTDYLLLDRPVIFYCYDLDEYLAKSNEMYHNYWEVTPGPKTETFDGLLGALKTAIHRPEGYAEERKRVLEIFYSPDNRGPVAEKQVDYLLRNIIGVESADPRPSSSLLPMEKRNAG
ncbi:CDP-glycerol glycerophosphotransferase (TagB/SpsB family) [Melghirimyces profundicolus]|uniref:CDP-glycerol glycerophosphotransferase (TagB/SpsB family) n=1 Tax=Melghirimyces profundicolus TaxID=1242148 RepID=A0A2T6B243_9BACL|nr:CDP-glycerol glycerophosphotransferase family protein [Melghirimyces profundicolus]PTX50140.1 CDP-glycerol glycerophosphotransferase (TagB/SpsB family) [Melghirimyces profundicolus]